jgi:hypothetical protein
MPEDLEPQIGDIYDVRITEAHEYDLVGEIVVRRSTKIGRIPASPNAPAREEHGSSRFRKPNNG